MALKILSIVPVLAFWVCLGGSRCTVPEEFERIVAELDIETGSRIADVGAAGGTWTRLLARFVGSGGQVFGTDVKESFLEGVRSIARQKGFEHVTPVLGDQEDTGLPPSSCDAILLRLVYHAFDNATAMRQSLFAALKPGGRILVIDFRPEPGQLAAAMADSGFEPGTFFESWCGQEGVYAQVFLKK